MSLRLHNMSGVVSASSLTVGGWPVGGADHYADPIAAGGIFVPHRRLITAHSVGTLGTGVLHMTTFIAAKAEPINTITAYTGSTAAAATPTVCRYGIWTVASNGAITLVGSTPNDTALFASTFTNYPKALSATVTLTAGQLYAVGLLVVTGAAMPTFHGVQQAATSNYQGVAVLHPASSLHLSAQTDLPTGVTPIGSTVTFMFRLS